MNETRYMISDTAKMVAVETHVLRYWEEELELEISRNELGHRYYTEENISLFRNIKELKERGFQLKAIKVLIPELKKKALEEDGRPDTYHVISLEEQLSKRSATAVEEKKEETTEIEAITTDLDKLRQFEEIIGNIFKQVLQDNNIELETRITDTMVREVDVLLQMQEQREEARYRKLDATIRAHQRKRGLVAATEERGVEKKKRRFPFFK